MAQQQRSTAAGKSADYLDQRTSIGVLVKEFARKVFPDHWSFMLGEVALFSFVVLIASGIFLTMFFEPSMALVRYEGEHPAVPRCVSPRDGAASKSTTSQAYRRAEVTGYRGCQPADRQEPIIRNQGNTGRGDGT